ncbi:capsule biosynthesis protein [Alphaproteobacteria bacterium LSUCC0396]
MSRSFSTWVITTLAIYQTRFWAEIGQHLQAQGQPVAFLSFDDRSTEYLAEKKFKVYSVSAKDRRQAEYMMQSVEASLSYYGIDNLNFWLTHERFAFDLRDSQEMSRRLMTYLVFADRSLSDLSEDCQPVMIQELGGFISVIASFFSARKHGVDNWFVEPSFFRGRQFFLKNRFSAIEIPQMPVKAACSEVKDYLSEAKANKTIVMPLKDKHHYSAAVHKIFNWHNIRRLIEKTIDKYLLGKHQEFGHLGSHVFRHVGMLLNSIKLAGSYTEISKLERFVYYPLHVPGDMALTLRSPQFLDQLGLIDYLVRNLPNGYKLAIKEHPAMTGAVDASRLKKLLKRYDQLALINPANNNYDILCQCDAVVSVNSKSGAEAILLGKPVLALGDSFYRTSSLVLAVDNLSELPTILKTLIRQPKSKNREQIEIFFEQVWGSSYPGELYINEPGNLALFAQSMQQAMINEGNRTTR